MRIKKITSSNRRDFDAILVCEHCEHEQELIGGYDDDYYHNNVLPKIKCKVCGKVAPSDYSPRATKYAEGDIV